MYPVNFGTCPNGYMLRGTRKRIPRVQYFLELLSTSSRRCHPCTIPKMLSLVFQVFSLSQYLALCGTSGSRGGEVGGWPLVESFGLGCCPAQFLMIRVE